MYCKLANDPIWVVRNAAAKTASKILEVIPNSSKNNIVEIFIKLIEDVS